MEIKRNLLKELISHLPKKEMSFIIGPRQAGKTTLMLFLRDYLEKRGQKTVFLNLDIEQDKKFFASQQDLVRKIQLEIGKGKGFVFLDEIQRKENAGLFLKGIFDMNLPYKFIVSGSGSMELKEKIHESLVGRKRIFELSTLTFGEFVNYKTNYQYQNRLKDFFSIEQEKTNHLLEEYLNFGGYPRVVLEEIQTEKQKTIDEIYQSYLEKDIAYLLQVKKGEAFTSLVKLMASQIGKLTNFSELSSILGLSVKTLKEYLWYLEKTFIIKKVTPYFKNLRKEITKSPVFYFYDLGLRNYIPGLFGEIRISQDIGFLFQNFVFHLLREETRDSACQIHFWRTKDGAEVDFIMAIGNKLIPIEVKVARQKELKISRSLKSFLEKYSPSRAYVINLNAEYKTKFYKTKVYFLPYYKIDSLKKELSK